MWSDFSLTQTRNHVFGTKTGFAESTKNCLWITASALQWVHHQWMSPTTLIKTQWENQLPCKSVRMNTENTTTTSNTSWKIGGLVKKVSYSNNYTRPTIQNLRFGSILTFDPFIIKVHRGQIPVRCYKSLLHKAVLSESSFEIGVCHKTAIRVLGAECCGSPQWTAKILRFK